MYIVLSVVAFIQSYLLPGSLAIRGLKYRETWVTTFLVAVPVSIFINYCIVFLLTLMGGYCTDVIRSIFVVECIFWFFLRKSTNRDLFARAGLFDRKELIFRAITSVVLLYFVTRWIKSLGTIMSSWDVVFSWNRWALDWSQSILPLQTWQYPQVVPILYSLNYQMVGDTTFQFSAKATVTALPLLGAFALFSLAWVNGSLRWVAFLSPIFFINILNRFVSPMTGLADDPLAAVAAMLVALCFGFRFALVSNQSYLFLTAIVASLAMLTKGSGLPYLVMFPFLVVQLGKRGSVRSKEMARALLLSVVVILSWYGYKQIQIALGTEGSVVGHVMGVVGLPYADRFHHGLTYFHDSLTYRELSSTSNLMLFGSFMALVLIGGFTSAAGASIFLFALVFFLIWAFGTAYDGRNFSPAIPLLAVLPALAIGRFFASRQVIQPKIDRFQPNWYWLSGFLFVATAYTQVLVKKEKLLEMHESQLLKIERSDVNEMVSSFFNSNSMNGRILSGYPIIALFPRLRGQVDAVNCHADSVEPFAENAGYLLVAGYCGQSYKNSVFEIEAKGNLRRLNSTSDGYVFYEILRPGLQTQTKKSKL
jgi:hypothetical protein